MRITGGTAQGRKLATPKHNPHRTIRPTSDLVREALFNILGKLPSDALVLDLFAGTGAIGIEALSRGAHAVIFVDHSKTALNLIHHNLTSSFSAPNASLIQCRLDSRKAMDRLKTKLPDSIRFDLVFLDPPYMKNLALQTLLMVEEANILRPGATIVVEDHDKADLPESIGSLQIQDQRKYGSTGIWIYKN